MSHGVIPSNYRFVDLRTESDSLIMAPGTRESALLGGSLHIGNRRKRSVLARCGTATSAQHCILLKFGVVHRRA